MIADDQHLAIHTAAQEVCIALEKDGLLDLVTCHASGSRLLRSLRDLAMLCGCTNVEWWEPDLGDSKLCVLPNE